MKLEIQEFNLDENLIKEKTLDFELESDDNVIVLNIGNYSYILNSEGMIHHVATTNNIHICGCGDEENCGCQRH